MPKLVSHCAVVGGCDIWPAARMCPVANGTTWTAAPAAAGTALTAAVATAALPAPSTAIAVMAALRTRTIARELLIPSPPFRRLCPNRAHNAPGAAPGPYEPARLFLPKRAEDYQEIPDVPIVSGRKDSTRYRKEGWTLTSVLHAEARRDNRATRGCRLARPDAAPRRWRSRG